MRLVLVFAVLALVVSAVAVADDTPAAKLEAIKKQHTDAQDAYSKAAEAIPDTPEGQKKYDELFKAFDKGQGDRFQAAVDLAKADPKSAFALEALEWVLTIPRAYYLPAGLTAMDLTAEHHAANPKVGKIIAWVGYYPPHPMQNEKAAVAAWALIKTVAEKNPDQTARGQAHLVLALDARKKYSEAEYKKADNAEKLATAAEAGYEALIKDYDDCRRLAREDSGTIGEFAKAELFELRNLRIGKVAPDIAGDDLDGSSFKLSDSRGKVTVLVFWAKWCGPCMAMVPHEKKLVEKMAGKPFVLVGVNGDDKREVAKETTEKEGMTWRSFWNGKGGPKGPITTDWNVRSWPTVYVLDAKGVIRFKNLRGEQLDKAVEQLVKELEDK